MSLSHRKEEGKKKKEFLVVLIIHNSGKENEMVNSASVKIILIY